MNRMTDPVRIPGRLLKLALLWAEGKSVAELAVTFSRSERQIRRSLRRPEVATELRAIVNAECSRILAVLALKAIDAIDRIERDIESGNESMVRLMANKALLDPIVRLATLTATMQTKTPPGDTEESKAAEIRRFLAAADAMESGGS